MQRIYQSYEYEQRNELSRENLVYRMFCTECLECLSRDLKARCMLFLVYFLNASTSFPVDVFSQQCVKTINRTRSVNRRLNCCTKRWKNQHHIKICDPFVSYKRDWIMCSNICYSFQVQQSNMIGRDLYDHLMSTKFYILVMHEIINLLYNALNYTARAPLQ